MAADALTQDAHTVHLAARFDNMMCLACIDDKRLDRPLVCNSLIDMEANSTYHGDADHMRNTMADMWDSAFDAAAENNGLGSVKPAALATGAEELLEMIRAVAGIGTCVRVLFNQRKRKELVNMENLLVLFETFVILSNNGSISTK